jgi:transposase
MSGSYRGLIKKVLPNADIVADRFHVMKLVNDELNRARNTEKRAISKLKDTPKKKKLESIFKNSKYALLKPEKNLTEKQKIKLEEIKKAFPNLAKMHQQKESLRIIFRQFKCEVQQVLMDENKVLRKAFDSQEIFAVCD